MELSSLIKPESRKEGLDLPRSKRDRVVFSFSIVNLYVNQMWRGHTGGDLFKCSRKPWILKWHNAAADDCDDDKLNTCSKLSLVIYWIINYLQQPCNRGTGNIPILKWGSWRTEILRKWPTRTFNEWWKWRLMYLTRTYSVGRSHHH